MNTRRSNHRIIERILIATIASMAGPLSAAGASLDITARNDRPGPVQIRVEAEDGQGNTLLTQTVSWTFDDNSFSLQSLTAPDGTRLLRLTFINDVDGGTPDTDRNAYIDFFELDGIHREAEAWDATGGTDIAFPGCGVVSIDGRTVADCGNQNDFVEYLVNTSIWKAGHTNYAPSGMPDFDQKQARWSGAILCGSNLLVDTMPFGDDVLLSPGPCVSSREPVVGPGPNGLMDTLPGGDDIDRWEYCVPTAVANCLWWFDSKFEMDPLAPACDPNDTYDLVTAYTPTVGGDHCSANVDDASTPAGGTGSDPNTAFGELVEDLAWRMRTTGQRMGVPRSGTTAIDAKSAVEDYLRARKLFDDYVVSLIPSPSFDFIADEVERSQDLILFVSFVQSCPPSPPRFIGGHAVTVAGVHRGRMDLCLSDPYLDIAEAGGAGRILPPPGLPHPHTSPPDALHNDAALVSHDCYTVMPATPGPYGGIALPFYATVPSGGEPEPTGCDDIANFHGQNPWDPADPSYEAAGCDGSCPVETIISFALEISPFTWKAGGFDDYAPSGVPDIDQKQSTFTCPLVIPPTWSHCGPAAAANSLWWFDSKFEPLPMPPPIVNDNHPLVSSFGAWDDHDPLNVDPLLADLAFRMNTNDMGVGFPFRGGPFCGTYIDDMKTGIDGLLSSTGLDSDYYTEIVRAPSFDLIADHVEMSNDVILLLGFWQLQNSTWVRIGGHYVTASGVDRAGGLIGLSDPFLDASENGQSGRVLGPHPHPAAGTVHNEVRSVSHDIYEAVATSSPGGIWGPRDYDVRLGIGPDGLDNFQGQNSSDELDAEEHPTGPYFPGPDPVVTEVDHALLVQRCPLDADGDGYDPICDLDCDDSDPSVNPGSVEICDGVDNDCDALVDEGFDADGDGVASCFDCDPTDGNVWSSPSEAQNLMVTYGIALGTTDISWAPPAAPGQSAASNLVYDTIGSQTSQDFVTSAVCIETDDGSDTVATDTTAVSTGAVLSFLVRAENQCPGSAALGSVGTDSSGLPRLARTCP